MNGVADTIERVKLQLNRFAAFTVDVIYGRRTGRGALIWGTILFLLSLVFRGLTFIRRQLYHYRIFRAQHLGCLVVVVGNLTVGGTGKTPVVEKLARTLHDKGRKVAILSRGYKSKKEPVWGKWLRWLLHKPPAPPRVVSDGSTIFFDSEVAGDEPYMLARNLPGVVVVTDKDRVKAGLYAIRNFGVDTLILDDGFQYFQLKDHLQLLLIDKTNPFGNGQLLPRGILREPIGQMERASYVFLTKSEEKPSEELLDTLSRHRSESEWIECSHQPKYLQSVFDDDQLPLDWLKGKRVGALSGIAVPESFETFLDKLGASAIEPFRFLDHHRFSDLELRHVKQKIADENLDVLVTTEKDAVRITREFDPGLPFYFLRVEINLLSGANNFEEAVRRICFPRQATDADRWESGLTRPPFSAVERRA
ncbi:MAG: tetraacyldisaccharide 4'-kinase [Puniceicoccaceae bacterium]